MRAAAAPPPPPLSLLLSPLRQAKGEEQPMEDSIVTWFPLSRTEEPRLQLLMLMLLMLLTRVRLLLLLFDDRSEADELLLFVGPEVVC